MSFSHDGLTDSLDSDANHFTYHEYLESSGISRFSGAFGDIRQRQSRTSFKPKFVWNAHERAQSSHVITLGGEVRSTSSFYERPEDVVFEQYYCVRDNGREGCRDQDGDGVSSAGDEYLNRRSFYYAGKVDVNYSDISFYVQDAITFDRWEWTVGLRADRNSYLDNFDLSPRISAVAPLGEAGLRKLHLGVSRYYGRSFMRYQLNDEIYGWRESYANLTRIRGRPGEEVPCSVPDWENCTHLTYDNRTGASDLDTPFSDEMMIGWSQPLGRSEMKLQFVNRKGAQRRLTVA